MWVFVEFLEGKAPFYVVLKSTQGVLCHFAISPNRVMSSEILFYATVSLWKSEKFSSQYSGCDVKAKSKPFGPLFLVGV